MLWIRFCPLLASLLALCLLGNQACSPPAACTSDRISNTALNPASSRCTRSCECNNQNFRGACISGKCVAFARDGCNARGAERDCRIEESLGGTCRKGIQVCRPDYLTSDRWGDCEPNCEACQPGKDEACYTGPKGTLGVGICVAGTKTCTAKGIWGTCEGQKLPTTEECNGKDDDCDGSIDEEVSSCVITIAGDGTQGYTDGQGKNAQFSKPIGLALDAAGNLYVADSTNHLIRKFDTAGNVTTFAGSTQGYTDGQGKNAQFYKPQDLVLDADGTLYVADTGNHRIRKIDPQGNVTTFAGSTQGYTDGQGKNAQFSFPYGLALDANGTLYVVDSNNNRIRKIDTSGNVTTLAGNGMRGAADGQGTSAQFYFPRGLAIDASGNLYVADTQNHRIRKIDTSGMVTTIAGSTQGAADGQGTNAQFSKPSGLALDAAGNLYVADSTNHRIRKIDTSGNVTTFAGDGKCRYDSTTRQYVNCYKDGPSASAQFNSPYNLFLDTAGNLYVTDTFNHRIRKITP